MTLVQQFPPAPGTLIQIFEYPEEMFFLVLDSGYYDEDYRVGSAFKVKLLASDGKIWDNIGFYLIGNGKNWSLYWKPVHL
jgi:hypothetical protein